MSSSSNENPNNAPTQPRPVNPFALSSQAQTVLPPKRLKELKLDGILYRAHEHTEMPEHAKIFQQGLELLERQRDAGVVIEGQGAEEYKAFISQAGSFLKNIRQVNPTITSLNQGVHALTTENDVKKALTYENDLKGRLKAIQFFSHEGIAENVKELLLDIDKVETIASDDGLSAQNTQLESTKNLLNKGIPGKIEILSYEDLFSDDPKQQRNKAIEELKKLSNELRDNLLVAYSAPRLLEIAMVLSGMRNQAIDEAVKRINEAQAKNSITAQEHQVLEDIKKSLTKVPAMIDCQLRIAMYNQLLVAFRESEVTLSCSNGDYLRASLQKIRERLKTYRKPQDGKKAWHFYHAIGVLFRANEWEKQDIGYVSTFLNNDGADSSHGLTDDLLSRICDYLATDSVKTPSPSDELKAAENTLKAKRNLLPKEIQKTSIFENATVIGGVVLHKDFKDYFDSAKDRGQGFDLLKLFVPWRNKGKEERLNFFAKSKFRSITESFYQLETSLKAGSVARDADSIMKSVEKLRELLEQEKKHLESSFSWYGLMKSSKNDEFLTKYKDYIAEQEEKLREQEEKIADQLVKMVKKHFNDPIKDRSKDRQLDAKEFVETAIITPDKVKIYRNFLRKVDKHLGKTSSEFAPKLDKVVNFGKHFITALNESKTSVQYEAVKDYKVKIGSTITFKSGDSNNAIRIREGDFFGEEGESLSFHIKYMLTLIEQNYLGSFPKTHESYEAFQQLADIVTKGKYPENFCKPDSDPRKNRTESDPDAIDNFANKITKAVQCFLNLGEEDAKRTTKTIMEKVAAHFTPYEASLSMGQGYTYQSMAFLEKYAPHIYQAKAPASKKVYQLASAYGEGTVQVNDDKKDVISPNDIALCVHTPKYRGQLESFLRANLDHLSHPAIADEYILGALHVGDWNNMSTANQSANYITNGRWEQVATSYLNNVFFKQGGNFSNSMIVSGKTLLLHDQSKKYLLVAPVKPTNNTEENQQFDDLKDYWEKSSHFSSTKITEIFKCYKKILDLGKSQHEKTDEYKAIVGLLKLKDWFDTTQYSANAARSKGITNHPQIEIQFNEQLSTIYQQNLSETRDSEQAQNATNSFRKLAQLNRAVEIILIGMRHTPSIQLSHELMAKHSLQLLKHVIKVKERHKYAPSLLYTDEKAPFLSDRHQFLYFEPHTTTNVEDWSISNWQIDFTAQQLNELEELLKDESVWTNPVLIRLATQFFNKIQQPKVPALQQQFKKIQSDFLTNVLGKLLSNENLTKAWKDKRNKKEPIKSCRGLLSDIKLNGYCIGMFEDALVELVKQVDKDSASQAALIKHMTPDGDPNKGIMNPINQYFVEAFVCDKHVLHYAQYELLKGLLYFNYKETKVTLFLTERRRDFLKQATENSYSPDEVSQLCSVVSNPNYLFDGHYEGSNLFIKVDEDKSHINIKMHKIDNYLIHHKLSSSIPQRVKLSALFCSLKTLLSSGLNYPVNKSIVAKLKLLDKSKSRSFTAAQIAEIKQLFENNPALIANPNVLNLCKEFFPATLLRYLTLLLVEQLIINGLVKDAEKDNYSGLDGPWDGTVAPFRYGEKDYKNIMNFVKKTASDNKFIKTDIPSYKFPQGTRTPTHGGNRLKSLIANKQYYNGDLNILLLVKCLTTNKIDSSNNDFLVKQPKENPKYQGEKPEKYHPAPALMQTAMTKFALRCLETTHKHIQVLKDQGEELRGDFNRSSITVGSDEHSAINLALLKFVNSKMYNYNSQLILQMLGTEKQKEAKTADDHFETGNSSSSSSSSTQVNYKLTGFAKVVNDLVDSEKKLHKDDQTYNTSHARHALGDLNRPLELRVAFKYLLEELRSKLLLTDKEKDELDSKLKQIEASWTSAEQEQQAFTLYERYKEKHGKQSAFAVFNDFFINDVIYNEKVGMEKVIGGYRPHPDQENSGYNPYDLQYSNLGLYTEAFILRGDFSKVQNMLTNIAKMTAELFYFKNAGLVDTLTQHLDKSSKAKWQDQLLASRHEAEVNCLYNAYKLVARQLDKLISNCDSSKQLVELAELYSFLENYIKNSGYKLLFDNYTWKQHFTDRFCDLALVEEKPRQISMMTPKIADHQNAPGLHDRELQIRLKQLQMTELELENDAKLLGIEKHQYLELVEELTTKPQQTFVYRDNKKAWRFYDASIDPHIGKRLLPFIIDDQSDEGLKICANLDMVLGDKGKLTPAMLTELQNYVIKIKQQAQLNMLMELLNDENNHLKSLKLFESIEQTIQSIISQRLMAISLAMESPEQRTKEGEAFCRLHDIIEPTKASKFATTSMKKFIQNLIETHQFEKAVNLFSFFYFNLDKKAWGNKLVDILTAAHDLDDKQHYNKSIQLVASVLRQRESNQEVCDILALMLKSKHGASIVDDFVAAYSHNTSNEHASSSNQQASVSALAYMKFIKIIQNAGAENVGQLLAAMKSYDACELKLKAQMSMTLYGDYLDRLNNKVDKVGGAAKFRELESKISQLERQCNYNKKECSRLAEEIKQHDTQRQENRSKLEKLSQSFNQLPKSKQSNKSKTYRQLSRSIDDLEKQIKATEKALSSANSQNQRFLKARSMLNSKLDLFETVLKDFQRDSKHISLWSALGNDNLESLSLIYSAIQSILSKRLIPDNDRKKLAKLKNQPELNQVKELFAKLENADFNQLLSDFCGSLAQATASGKAGDNNNQSLMEFAKTPRECARELKDLLKRYKGFEETANAKNAVEAKSLVMQVLVKYFANTTQLDESRAILLEALNGDSLQADVIEALAKKLTDEQLLGLISDVSNSLRAGFALRDYKSALSEMNIPKLSVANEELKQYLALEGGAGLIVKTLFDKLLQDQCSTLQDTESNSWLAKLHSHEAIEKEMGIKFDENNIVDTSNYDKRLAYLNTGNRRNEIIEACQKELRNAAVKAKSLDHFMQTTAYKNLVKLACVYVRYYVNSMRPPADRAFTQTVLKEVLGDDGFKELARVHIEFAKSSKDLSNNEPKFSTNDGKHQIIRSAIAEIVKNRFDVSNQDSQKLQSSASTPSLTGSNRSSRNHSMSSVTNSSHQKGLFSRSSVRSKSVLFSPRRKSNPINIGNGDSTNDKTAKIRKQSVISQFGSGPKQSSPLDSIGHADNRKELMATEGVESNNNACSSSRSSRRK